MEQKKNKWGVIKGLAFPIGYTTFMNVGQTILSVALIIIVLFRSIIAAMTYNGIGGTDTILEWFNYDNTATTMQYAMFFSALTTIGALVILWLVFNRKGKSFTEYFRFTKAPAKAIIAAVLLGLSLHFIVNAVMFAGESLLNALLEMLMRAMEALDPAIAEEFRIFYETYTEMMSSMSQDVGMFTIAAIFGAPLIEELVFRAGPLVNFKGKLPTWAALLITSALFGLAHGAPIQIAYTFVVGLVLGALFIKTDSIYPCIIGHFCFNAANMIPMLMEGLLGGPYQNDTMVEWLNIAYIVYIIAAAVIAVPMLIVGLILLFKLRKPEPMPVAAEQIAAETTEQTFPAACEQTADQAPDQAIEEETEISVPDFDGQGEPAVIEQEEDA
ncbi:MAG: CPBP family intramembrane metalloprotease [Clostridia bacterium]|nr:CPBP family intramembrane metalloprotease [Clostridia bacterium]